MAGAGPAAQVPGIQKPLAYKLWARIWLYRLRADSRDRVIRFLLKPPLSGCS